MKTLNSSSIEDLNKSKDSLALICGEDKISYAQLNQRVASAASYLKEFGIKNDDRVAIFCPNSVEHILCLLALWKMGAVACLLSTRQPEEIINEQLKSISCRYLITPLNSLIESTRIQALKINLSAVFSHQSTPEAEYSFSIENFPKDKDATIVFTSGTTQQAKAVLHTFGNHYFSAKGSNKNIPIHAGDRWLLSLPLYHVSGLGILFRMFIGGGAVVIPYAGEDISYTINKYKVTHLSLVPTQLFRLLKEDGNFIVLKNLKVILLGGSSIPMNLLKLAKEYRLPICLTYGLTEMSSQVATSTLTNDSNILDNVHVLTYRQVKISDQAEIWVKGETLFKGYISQGKLERLLTEDGWFKTGDLGIITESGSLKVTGRKDNMFISGGENIRPEEIERHLCQIENIEEAIVIPVEHEEFGFRPVAFIKHNGQISNKKEILSVLAYRLPKFMTPERFYNWPATLDGNEVKVSRQRLMQLVHNRNPDLSEIN